MSKAHGARVGFLVVVAFLLAPLAGFAQSGESFDERAGWHVVRPGETLRIIAERYLGDSERWDDLWKLNPEIEDADLVLPGQRLRVRVIPEPQAPFAQMVKVAGRVEKKPQPNPWGPAAVEDLLNEHDGVRSRASSSAEMRFNDGKGLILTEQSLVFLRRVGSGLGGVPREEIEIVEGQAELAGNLGSAAMTDIEIFVGEARMKPEVGAGGEIQTRARRVESGGAQVMVYEGQGAVEAGGQSVAVEAGMGTSVPEEGPPAEPEELLDPPQTVLPAPGASFPFANPSFEWEAVPDAAGYVFEICRDPQCAEVVRRATGLTEASWVASKLPTGDFLWRATAVSASGLDGFPSAPTAFSVTGDGVDLAAPVGTIRHEGPSAMRGSDLVLGSKAKLVVETSDDASGVAGIVHTLDSEVVAVDSFDGPWEAGARRAAGELWDHVGNRSEIAAFDFVSDPDPPRISAELGGADLVRAHGDPAWQPTRASLCTGLRMRRQGVVAEWSADGQKWLPIRVDLYRIKRASNQLVPTEVVTIRADSPQIFVRPPGDRPGRRGNPLGLERGEILRLSARDEGAGVLVFEVQLKPSRDETGDFEYYVEIAAVDLVENRSGSSWSRQGKTTR